LVRGCEALEQRLALAGVIMAPDGNAYYPDKVIVRFQPDATQQQINALVGSVNGTIDKSFTGALAGLKIIGIPEASQNAEGVQRFLNKFHAGDVVKYVEANWQSQLQTIPNDPLFNRKWDLNNTGQLGGLPDADIDAPEAWDIETGSKSVVVAVMDTGIALTHPDLVGNLWTNPAETPNDGIDNDGNGFIDDVNGYDFVNVDNIPDDDNSHGTHVSGIIGAKGNNGVGVVGVNWDVSIMSLKVASAAGGLTAADILSGFDYVRQEKLTGINLVAVNCSFGGGPFDPAMRDAIIALRDAGVLVVCAAGNSSSDNDAIPFFPAGFNVDNVISVAATNNRDQLASFSSFGQTTVDLAAPGEAVYSTFPTAFDPTGYSLDSGTSMATPEVTGAAALIAAAQPGLTYAQIRDLILENVDPIPALKPVTDTGGRLNVNNALEKLGRSTAEGTVFIDRGGDGGDFNPGFDAPLPNNTVWYDINKNGALDPGEPQSLSDANGHWLINKLPARSSGIQLRISPPPDYQVTFPNDGSGQYTVFFAFNGEDRSGLDFGLFGPPGQIEGHKWFDLNGNASLDPAQGDGPMQGAFIYVDIDGDGRPGIGEPASITNASGEFIIKNVPVGSYPLRESMQPGFGISFPQQGYHQFTMTPKASLTGYDFFNSPAHDYGDAPDSYHTVAANNGAVHGYLQGFGLGSKLDADGNGHPGPNANGDDSTGMDDEDGVIFKNAPSPGHKFNFTVTVMVPPGTHPGYLNAWMDLNRDGDFADSGEKIIGAKQLAAGTYAFSIPMPASIPVGKTFMRFRYGPETNLGFAGPSQAGEVEDYAVTVIGLLPTAKDDTATVQQFSKNNKIDVLANDVASVNGNPKIDVSSFPATSKLGGKLTIDKNGTPNDPYDDFVRYDAAVAPVDPTKKFYTDSFQYTITDGTNFDTATVTITVNKISTLPVPVDDTVVASPTGTTALNGLLVNDIRGTDHGIPVSKVSLYSFDSQVKDESGATIGAITRNNHGTPNDFTDDTLIFTPVAGANGKTGQFTYVLRNPNTSDPAKDSSPATVTVQVHGDNTVDGNDKVKVSLEVRNTTAAGGVATTVPTQLVQGQKYWVGVFADDLRAAFNDQGGNNANGALSVYLDLLFNKSYVSPIKVAKDSAHPLGLNIVYVDPYKTGNTGKTGDANTAGLINELGVTSSQSSIGTANKAVLYIQFTASAVTPGTTPLVLWTTDPADQRAAIDPKFSHDIYVVDRTDTTKIDALPISEIAYFHARTYRVVAAPAASFAEPESAPKPSAPPAQQQNMVTSSSSSSPSALDAVLASMYGDDSPYKKK
jgi:subtilisin family serine protease